MKQPLVHRVALTTVLLTIVGALWCPARKSNWQEDADRRKASQYYIEAVNAFIDQKFSLYHELLNRAIELDPQDPELNARAGEWIILTNPSDQDAVSRGFEMMFDAYRKGPADYFEGMQLLNLTSNLGRWNDHLRVAELLAKQFPDRSEVKIQQGRSYMYRILSGDSSYVRPAIDIFNSLQSKTGPSIQLSSMKIRTYAIVNDTASVIRELDALRDAFPADPYTAMTIGQVYNSLSLPDSALTYFDRACQLDSTNGNAILMRASFFQERGDSAVYEREAMRAIKSPDLDFESKSDFVISYLNTHSGDSVRENRIDSMFEALLDIHTGEPEVYRLYSAYLAQQKHFPQAAEQMTYVVSLDPSERDNWLFLAQLYVSAEDFAKAADVLADGSVMFPSDPVFIRPQAAYRSMAGDHRTAIAVLRNFPDSTITDIEERSQFKTLLGDLYYQADSTSLAFQAYEDALTLDPYNYMAMNNVAYYYAETDTLLDKAESYAARVIRHEPDNTTYLDTYAWVLYKKGDYQSARQQIDRTIELIEFENSLDSIDSAIASIENVAAKTVSEEPGSPDNIDEEAVEVIEQEAAPGSADLYDHAGDIYFRLGEIDRAVNFWQKALERNPDNKDAIKAKIKHRKIIDKP